jgi:hypothetical protein
MRIKLGTWLYPHLARSSGGPQSPGLLSFATYAIGGPFPWQTRDNFSWLGEQRRLAFAPRRLDSKGVTGPSNTFAAAN